MNFFNLILFIIVLFLILRSCRKKFEKFGKKAGKLVFMHIPKNAGTTIENIGREHGYNWGRFDKNNLKNIPINLNCSYWHIPPKNLSKDYYNINPSFTVVRNPYDRIISEYNYRSKMIRTKPTKEKLNLFIKKHLNNEFKENIFDCHLIPQVNYINGANIDDILYFENLSSDFSKLSKKYNLGFELNQHTNKSSSIPGAVTRKDLNHESIHLIQKFYHGDFKKFGYSR